MFRFTEPFRKIVSAGAARIAAGCVMALGLGAVPATPQAPTMELLDRIERGAWVLDYRGSAQKQRVCVRTGRELTQLRNPGPKCRRYVVESSANQVTVQYSCGGAGYTRTSIRRESGTLLQITGQGMNKSRPFQFSAEARRAGSC